MGLKTLLSTKHVKLVKYTDEDIERRNHDDPRINPQKRLLTPFLIDKKIPPIPTDDERIDFPFRSTNLLSELFFTWCAPVLQVGYRRTILPEDLYIIRKGSKYDVEKRTEAFLHNFYYLKDKVEAKFLKKHHIEDTEENRRNLKFNKDFNYPSYLVLLALYKTYMTDYNIGIFCKAVADVASAVNTLQIRALIRFINDKSAGKDAGNKGYGFAIGISLIVFVFGTLYARSFNDCSFCGAEIKGVLTKVLLDKSFRLSKESRIKFPASAVTAYLGNDLSKIDLAANFFPFILCMPIGLGITIALLAVNLGGASLAGIAWFILIAGGITYTTRFLMRWRRSVNVQTDGRVYRTKEVLNNIKMIKYYAWEIPFTKLISILRGKEMKIMLKVQVFRNMVTGVAVSLPAFSSMVGFLSMYGQLHGLKNAANIFSSVTLFNILTGHIAMFPTALTSASDAWVAFSRVQEFLLAEESQPDPEYHRNRYDKSKPAISIINGCFDWEIELDRFSEDDETETVSSKSEKSKENLDHFNLHDINIDIKHGEFTVITGGIGSGKSSLLAAIDGTMNRLEGSVNISGDIVFCSFPWIQNTTVRENITFGLPYDKDVYGKVIEVCSLGTDFELLPAGDMTEIGERGVNLSGGQKARINLARSVYRSFIQPEKYNIIMFDDVLSAVDAKVGKHIMHECILGLLKDKTRLLATHQLSLIGEADRIIYMNGDGTIDVGTSDELLKRNQGFKNLMDFQMENEDEREENEELEAEEVEEEEAKLIKKQTTIVDDEKGRLIMAEVSKTNGIPLKTITTYLASGSGQFGLKVILPNLALAIALTTFCMLFQNVWLSFWSTGRFKRSDGFYIGIYVMFTILFILTAIWQFCTIIFITNRSSTLLNVKAINNIMHAPMSFFDTTPMGRIINRFTKDTDVLDNEIAEQARLCCMGFGNMMGIIIMCCIFLPWFAIAVPFLAFYVTSCFNYYQATAREVKRIESVKRSLVFSSFDESLNGMDTIKLFSSTKRFIDKNTNMINSMNEAYFYTIGVQRWMAMTLHGCSATVNLIITMVSASGSYSISAASAGLLISYIVQLSLQLISFSKSLGQAEQYLSSVERVVEYVNELPQEAAYTNEADEKVPAEWPNNGEIVFENVSLRYRPELPHVLKNLSLHIKPGEKIGIVGRTGAGKSTITTALYRLSEPDEGRMYIDGQNIQEIGLFKLRSQLSIIPQDPVLFKGTIRSNLDPFEEVDDEILRKAVLLSCGSNKFPLDMEVEDGGTNFSLGERQVIALCRALIRKSKILILDEATSSVDYETDARIQSTIAEGFKDSTILCIAHRLKTILKYDRILVMDHGEKVEFDTPYALWLQCGIFKSMCDKSGINENDF
ncbi:hypothetical protein CANINC_000899 [Pichia inconspicua]|uniref:Oligomycin resistance ATP-dependent permease YOR1 n=1 Tax=Pichia inconspicua TaxID=52247 RepID=A0A4T0X5F8_9ASCO|nr:hypothetical protein CANINC_000899 [[Candida] inconspicua]